MAYLDEKGELAGFEGVSTKIALRRRHGVAVGPGADCVDQFNR